MVSGGQHVAARYLANGSLDTTFDTDGSILLQYQPEAQGGILHAVAADHEGRIVAAGYTAFPHNGVVMRFREDGTRTRTSASAIFASSPALSSRMPAAAKRSTT